MPYNDQLADRIREFLVQFGDNIEEKKMMGGLTFMYNGKMCCGIVKDTLMVRVIESKYQSALEKPYCRIMDFTGKPLKGFLFVDEPGFGSNQELHDWIGLGIEYVESAAIRNKKRRDVKKTV